jgi:hypothetical protein
MPSILRYLGRIRDILTSPDSRLDLSKETKARAISSQVQQWFEAAGWQREVPARAVPGMRYDLHDEHVPIEIELGHERLPGLF